MGSTRGGDEGPLLPVSEASREESGANKANQGGMPPVMAELQDDEHMNRNKYTRVRGWGTSSQPTHGKEGRAPTRVQSPTRW